MRSFTDQEPTEDFLWVFNNKDGSVQKLLTSMEAYYLFKVLYGIPRETKWELRA